MGRCSEPLREAVTAKEAEDRYGKEKRKPVWQKKQCANDKTNRAGKSEPPSPGNGNDSSGQMPLGSSWILTIDFTIDKSIKSHCGTASKYHATQNTKHRLKRENNRFPRRQR